MSEGPLREITLEITQECLNRCIYCSSSIGNTEYCPPLGLPLISSILDQAVGRGLHTLSLSGGEPFLHPDIEGILRACSAARIPQLLIYTSGLVRGNRGAAVPLGDSRLAAIMIRTGATLVFNIQCTLGQVHDRLAGVPGSLALTLRALRWAIDAGIPVECHVVPNKMNVSYLVRTAHELLSMGVRRVSFLRLVPQGNAARNWDLLRLDGADLTLMHAQLRTLAEEAGVASVYRFGVPFSAVLANGHRCQAGVSRLLVRCDGLCFPCEAFKGCNDPDYVLGDVHLCGIASAIDRGRRSSRLNALRRAAQGIEACPAQLLYAKRVAR